MVSTLVLHARVGGSNPAGSYFFAFFSNFFCLQLWSRDSVFLNAHLQKWKTSARCTIDCGRPITVWARWCVNSYVNLSGEHDGSVFKIKRTLAKVENVSSMYHWLRALYYRLSSVMCRFLCKPIWGTWWQCFKCTLAKVETSVRFTIDCGHPITVWARWCVDSHISSPHSARMPEMLVSMLALAWWAY